MSINNVFQTPKTKKASESCGEVVGALTMQVGFIFLTAWLIFSGVEMITDDGWGYWAVARLCFAVFIVAFWFRGRRA